MMAKRVRRGLADLSDSDDDLISAPLKQTSSNGTHQNSVSLFDTKVFTDTVLTKIRQEEEKVTKASMEPDVIDLEEPCYASLLNKSSFIPEQKIAAEQARRSHTMLSRKRAKVLTLISSSDDEAESNLTQLMRPPSTVSNYTSKESDQEDVNQKRQSALQLQHRDDSICLLEDEDEHDAESDQADHRILVKHFGVEDIIWIRLRRQDTMQRVFDEISRAVGSPVTLMIDLNGEREEVFPSQTIDDLKISVDRCTLIYSYPLSTDQERNHFKLKIVTANRRATKEVSCRPYESFGDIFQRYCDENSLRRDAVIFKFDGDVLLDTQTPQDHEMESGEQIEAHSTESHQVNGSVTLRQLRKR